MKNTIQWVRSVLFITQMYIMLPIVGFGCAPLMLIKRDYAFGIIRFYCNWVRWTASWMVGLKTEIRGEIPDGAVIVASKHQSFLDILLLSSALPRIKFIMKKELKWVPVISLYARFTGTIPVDRGKKGAAIKQMVAAVKRGADHGGRRKQWPGERLDVMPWRAGGVRLRSCRLQPAPAALAAAAITPPWQPWWRHHVHESALHKWSLNRLNSWL